MGLLKRLFGRKDDYFDAIVLLLTEFRNVDAEVVRSVLPAGSGKPEIVGGDGWLTLIAPDYWLNVLSGKGPYGPPGVTSEFLAAKCVDLRIRDYVLRHTAFVSINSNAQTPAPLREGARLMASRLAAALADETLVVLMDAESGRSIIANEASIEHLRLGDREAAFDDDGFTPLVAVDQNRLVDQVAEARRRYPEFRAAFLRNKEGSIFVLKMAFGEAGSDGIEHMWIEPTAVEESSVTGKLASSPHRLRGLREGDFVTKPITELTDWIFKEDGVRHGSFTEEVVMGG